MLSYVAAINHYKAPVKSKLIVLRNIGRLLHGLISWALNYIIFFYQFFTFDTFLQWNAWLHNFEKLGSEIFGWFICHFWLYLTTIPKKLRRWEALDIYGDAKCFSIYQNNGIKSKALYFEKKQYNENHFSIFSTRVPFILTSTSKSTNSLGYRKL